MGRNPSLFKPDTRRGSEFYRILATGREARPVTGSSSTKKNQVRNLRREAPITKVLNDFFYKSSFKNEKA
jgi:hypothetical protein